MFFLNISSIISIHKGALYIYNKNHKNKFGAKFFFSFWNKILQRCIYSHFMPLRILSVDILHNSSLERKHLRITARYDFFIQCIARFLMERLVLTEPRPIMVSFRTRGKKIASLLLLIKFFIHLYHKIFVCLFCPPINHDIDYSYLKPRIYTESYYLR